MSDPIRLALVGMGKIANDQHYPALTGDADFDLVACVDRDGSCLAHLPSFVTIEELAESGLTVDAVAICTPPQVRHDIAQFALEQGWHVLLEKPPGATLAEVVALREAAQDRGLALLASWHSRFAPCVDQAREWLAGREIKSGRIVWREDVRVWHPGQHWIWEPGGFGVFDPGINALSIATHILPDPMFVEQSELFFPGNCSAPIAAQVRFRDRKGALIAMDLDFRQEGKQSWDIVIETAGGTLTLSNGGADISTTGAPPPPRDDVLPGEYPALYRRFAELVRNSSCDVDVRPLRLVADAFLCGRITRVDDFIE